MAKNSLRRLLSILPLAALGFALGHSAIADASPLDGEDARLTPTIDAPFLWQIEGGAMPSYLFGTIHAGVESAELPLLVNDAIGRSPLFVMETSPGDVYPPPTGAVYPMGLPMDLSLARNAHQLGARVATLESMNFQLSLLKELLKELGGSRGLAAMLANDSDAIEPLVKAYRDGNLDAIAELTQSGDSSMREVFLTHRNYRWVRKLGRVLAQGGAFIAVGVGHIPGEDGLLDLLDRRGYSISRMA